MFQEAWDGNETVELKSVSKSWSVRQCHCGSKPNEREGISVIAFCFPGMCSGVNGDARQICNHNANARMSCMAIFDRLDARG